MQTNAEQVKNAEQAVNQLAKLTVCHIRIWIISHEPECIEKEFPDTTFKSVVQEIVRDGGLFTTTSKLTKRMSWIPLHAIQSIDQIT